jgi:hypothetical protein
LRGTDWIGEWDESMSAEYLKLLARHRREQDVVLAQFIALGIDPAPPADWTNDDSP